MLIASFIEPLHGCSLNETSQRDRQTFLLAALLTSKGSAAVVGAGFVTLAATVQTVPSIPIESLAILVGVDRFMGEGRAITNLIGNGIATLAVSKWEGELPAGTLKQRLNA